MIKIEIIITSKKDQELWMDDIFQASWGPGADYKKNIIPYALDVAFKMGQEAKATEIKSALDIK